MQSMIYYTYIQTPIGKVLLISSHAQLMGVRMEGQKNFSVIPNDWQYNDHVTVFINTKQQLDAYFTSKEHYFNRDYLLNGTVFQKHIWKILAQIPYGAVLTYKAFASLTAYPNAIRAIASTLAKNPFPIILPCHRVIRSNGSLGGYAAGVAIKQTLLELEQKQNTLTS